VLHSTEGANLKGIVDLKGLGDWFDNPAAQASSHVATDAEGNSARYVDDSVKAWSCVFYNSMSLNIEQVGRAAQTSWPDAQIQETARWVGRWADLFDIPIRQGHVSLDGRIIESGVVQHSDLGNSAAATTTAATATRSMRCYASGAATCISGRPDAFQPRRLRPPSRGAAHEQAFGASSVSARTAGSRCSAWSAATTRG
jgi:hypothetical protein